MQVHRCRFIDWVPDEVDSLAFSPDGSQLAVGRKAGTIEIYTQVTTTYHKTITPTKSTKTIETDITRRNWYRLLEIPGEAEGSAHSISWASSTRLLSGTLGGALLEWDLTTLTSRALPSNGGAIWCISVSPDRRLLAAACEDGAVRLYDLVDRDGEPCFEPRATLARRKERLLCVCWSPDGRSIYAGGTSGVVAGWDAASGRSTLSAALDALAGGSTVVWSIACAGPDVLVTGDSLGKTQLWDRATGAPLASFKEHQSDVLAVAADPRGDIIFASGVDNKLCLFQRAEAAGRWVCRGGIRRHTHDVRALAVHPPYIASAGVDTQVAVFTLESFAAGKADCLISPLQHAAAHLALAPAARLVLARFRRSLQLWRLGEAAAGEAAGEAAAIAAGVAPLAAAHAHLFDFDLSKGAASTLTCSGISRGGHFLACSDKDTLRIYSLDLGDNTGSNISIKRIRGKSKSPSILPLPAAHAVAFTPDEKHLVAASLRDPELRVYAITPNDVTLVRTMTWRDVNATSSQVAFALAVSPDSALVAAATLENVVRVFALGDGAPAAVVPPLAGRFTALAFAGAAAGSAGQRLVLTTTDARYYVWDVSAGGLTEFARALNAAGTRVLPVGEFPVGVAVCEEDGERACVFGNSWMVRVPLDEKVPSDNGNDEDDVEMKGVKKGVGELLVESVGKRVSVVRKYNLIMFVGFVGGQEVVVVERPWVHVLQKLPEPFNYSHFAT